MFIMTLGTFSCNTSVKNDEKKAAEKINDEKITNNKLERDADFIVEIYNTGLFEIKASELALTKSVSEDTKRIAKEILADHTKMNTELASLAATKSVTLPTDLGADYKSEYDKLNSLNGKDFDVKYVSMMVDDHQRSISAFEKESKKGFDTDIKTFAGKNLGVLNTHLQKAKAVKHEIQNEVAQNNK
jgi:putative membrane protein